MIFDDNISVESVMKHKQFNEMNADYDFVLLKLKEPLKFSNTIHSIKFLNLDVKFECDNYIIFYEFVDGLGQFQAFKIFDFVFINILRAKVT